MSITVDNGTRIALDVPWATGTAGFINSGETIQLAYVPVYDLAEADLPPKRSDSIEIQGSDFIVYDLARDASTQMRILYLVPA